MEFQTGHGPQTQSDDQNTEFSLANQMSPFRH